MLKTHELMKFIQPKNLTLNREAVNPKIWGVLSDEQTSVVTLNMAMVVFFILITRIVVYLFIYLSLSFPFHLFCFWYPVGLVSWCFMGRRPHLSNTSHLSCATPLGTLGANMQMNPPPSPAGRRLYNWARDKIRLLSNKN